MATGEARQELARWLVAGRQARGLERAQVAQITRIQLRTLERLEEGRFDELPADVFVRGFIRGYARCVGLPEEEALARYASCGFAAAPVASAQAQALLDSMATLVPETTRPTPLVRAPRVLGDDARPATTPDGGMVDVGVAVDRALAQRALGPVPTLAAPAVLAQGSLRDIPPVRSADPSAGGALACEGDSDGVPTEPMGGTTAPVGAEAADGAADGGRSKRRRKAPRAQGPVERDARGRFVRRTMSAPMPVVDVVALGLEAEARAFDAVTAPGASVEIVVTVEPAVTEPVAARAAIEVEAEAAMVAEPTLEPTFEPAVAEPAIAATAVEPAVREVAPAPTAAEPASASLATESASASAAVATTTGRFVPLPPRTSGIHVAPTLVIDDDDPEDAERAREERLASQAHKGDKGWRSFIPPALLDQQKGRQGGLTLAVIILLIVATLTLSYLMRRPSSTGDGITRAPAAATDLRA